MPIITLLTDFGHRDGYVGVMKGVILSRCPDTSIVDLTHTIAPQCISSAAYVLGVSWPYFPPGTVHVAVVDPGVGSDRRPIAARIAGHWFVAPDNGLLSDVLDVGPVEKIISLEADAIYLRPVSTTFHGRDIFAPVAAALAMGIDLTDLGPEISDPVRLPDRQAVRYEDGRIEGRVVHVDHFGNLITTIPGLTLPMQPTVEIADTRIAGLTTTYAAAEPGQPLAIIGSSGRLEISVNRGNAQQTLGVEVGETVMVTGRALG